ncbi:protein-export chaperone SecB [Bacillus cereus]|uniref:protein-export chaperone SecB n=1 Tax=Bacillus cereus TaxID=1396 RepID=UPI0026741FBE|nr:protein-export chaperone SecB [Bacillus cereus]WKT65265.1 protein-export chaperone SecB [Bacillus cereus]HEF5710464.1 protein-export chaperone SecB [Bacillus cereus]
MNNKEIKSSLHFIDYIVNFIEFSRNDDFEDGKPTIDFHINRKVDYLEDEENTMLVTIEVTIFDNPKEKNYPFSMKLNVTGIFELENVDMDKRVSFAEVNSVAILFPYIRSLITTYTSNANIPPLILPPINVLKLIEKEEEKAKKNK